MKTNYLRELLYLVALLALNAFFIYVIVLLASFISSVTSIPNWKFIAVIYIAVLVISYAVQLKFHDKISYTVFIVLVYPFRFLLFILTVGVPFFMLQLHIILFLLTSFGIPAALIYIYAYFTGNVIDDAFKTYIILTSAVILSTIFQNKIKFIARIFAPEAVRSSKALKPYKIDELSSYLFTENNMRTIIYVLYFIVLVLINAFNLRGIGFYHTPAMDDAFLQSFATFLAFDRIVVNLKLSEFKPSDMLRKMSHSIKAKLDDILARDVK